MPGTHRSRRIIACLYVIDVAARDKIPRKGGPGIMKSDLLIINKIDLAPHVGASLDATKPNTRGCFGLNRSSRLGAPVLSSGSAIIRRL